MHRWGRLGGVTTELGPGIIDILSNYLLFAFRFAHAYDGGVDLQMRGQCRAMEREGSQ